jgi:hypothetical protein
VAVVATHVAPTIVLTPAGPSVEVNAVYGATAVRIAADLAGMKPYLTGAEPSSRIGSASMSDRSATMGGCPVPTSAISPVPDAGRLPG